MTRARATRGPLHKNADQVPDEALLSYNQTETDLVTERSAPQKVGPRLIPAPPEFRIYRPMTRARSNAVEVLKSHPIVTSIVVGLAASAILNRVLAKMAERRNPPTGRFITIDGVRLHYVERGTGRPLVLLHGNGSMI